MYLPPAIPISPAELTYIIAELPPPLILLGNFTVKNVAWNAVFTDERGWLLTDICVWSYVIILNTASHMNLRLVSETSFTLDRTFCSPGLVVCLKCSVLAEEHGSQHYAINLHANHSH
jgi:hypothetical protein